MPTGCSPTCGRTTRTPSWTRTGSAASSGRTGWGSTSTATGSATCSNPRPAPCSNGPWLICCMGQTERLPDQGTQIRPRDQPGCGPQDPPAPDHREVVLHQVGHEPLVGLVPPALHLQGQLLLQPAVVEPEPARRAEPVLSCRLGDPRLPQVLPEQLVPQIRRQLESHPAVPCGRARRPAS